MPAPLSYNDVLREGSAAPVARPDIRRGWAARCRRQAATGKKISQKRFDAFRPITWLDHFLIAAYSAFHVTMHTVNEPHFHS